MKKCRCANCGKRFESKKEKVEHKKEYPSASCINIGVKGGKEINMVFGKKKKEKPVEAPEEDFGEIEDEEDEVEDEEDEVEDEEEPIKKKTKKSESLTIKEITEILAAHDEAIKRILYHLRI